MKFTADCEALHDAFQHVGSIITSTIARPIYQNVKIEASEEGVFLSATDLEVGLRVQAQNVEIEEEGAVLTPYSRISPILRATPDERITLEGDASSVTLKASDGQFHMVSENPEEYADISGVSEDSIIEVDPAVLQFMVDRTTFAAADEKGRYALNGILVIVDEDGNFEMVGADGARLANVKKKVSNPEGQTVDCIVMKKGIQQAARLALLSEEPLRFQATENQFFAENGRGRVRCQLVEGQFPNYHEVIPRENKFKAELPTKATLNALRRASFMTSDQTRVVDFTLSDGLLVLSSQSPDLGDAQVKVPIDYDGEEREIAFNPEYIQQVLEVVDRESVKMEFSDRGSPCVIRCGVDYVYVVSPVVREEAEK
ncbi:MAG: DNA polymerase III subunit beta [Candidatus Brocadiia bacterium]